ncbi:thioredoxin-like protein [Chytridium lagenaria]|nr:thioredoxin-like protein [Chytridium lagenaria]
MQQVGLAENITFSYGGLIGNTLDSHRLIGWAKGKNVQYELVEELFKDYFENEKDIADKEVLAEAAVRVGIDKKEAIAFLESKEGTDAVKKNLVKNRNEGIQGVPFYVINNKYRVSGAQEPESFIQIFEKLAAQGQTSL